MSTPPWTFSKFGQLCTHSAFGPRFSGDNYSPNGNVATLRTTDISADGRITTRTMPLATLDLARLSQHVLQVGDLVITRTGRVGTTAVFSGFDLPVLPGAFLIRFRLNRNVADPQFYRYYFNSPEGQLSIATVATGSVVENLNITGLHSLSVPVPHLKEQIAIARALESLDDKIDLNRRMNETLESMVRTVFRSWFVDFEPVRAKADGRTPAGMDAATAALFPYHFTDSPLGSIPAGWTVSRWGDSITLEYGKSLRNYDSTDAPYPVYGTNGPIGRHTEPLCTYPGIVIGRKGAYRGVHFSPEPFFVIDTAFYVKPKVDVELRWAYYSMLDLDINGMDSGSAIPSTSREDFYALPVVLPPASLQKRFRELLVPMWQQQEQNDKESRTLAAVRDSLLPRLLSGELRVPEAESIVEAAT